VASLNLYFACNRGTRGGVGVTENGVIAVIGLVAVAITGWLLPDGWPWWKRYPAYLAALFVTVWIAVSIFG